MDPFHFDFMKTNSQDIVFHRKKISRGIEMTWGWVNDELST